MTKSSVVAMLVLSVAACASAPKTASERISLEERARVTLSQMQNRDPSLRGVLMDAQAYVVFPEIGKGGVIVGGAYGRGVLYQRGQAVGTVSLAQASIGAQLGGQTFSELIVIRDANTLRKIKAGKFDVGADASVVALTSGAAESASLDEDTTVFVMPHGGLMVDVSVAGQRLEYTPFDISG